jgi:hypothetical protein
MATGHGGARVGAGAKPKTVADASGEAHVIYTKARAKREQHNAALAELQLREKEGELIEASQMRKEADAAAPTSSSKPLVSGSLILLLLFEEQHIRAVCCWVRKPHETA